MKSTKQSRNFTARAVSIAICLALIVCAVFSFGFIYNRPSGAFADEETGMPAAATENGIRFVQVAAGEDFAIGLTFDGKLYGWSLLDTEGGNTNIDTSTLGNYYSKTPTEIDVIFRVGPGTNGDNKWDNLNTYHKDLSTDNNRTDRIISIAATRTTAAFITENGYIYTWGKDCDVNKRSVEGVYTSESNATPHYLLLRDLTKGDNWYLPYIINYEYYGDQDNALPRLKPSNNISNFSIAAAEYNYIFGFDSGNYYHTYTWGSLLYSLPNTEPAGTYGYTSVGSGQPLYGGVVRNVFRTQYSKGASVSVVAGGYNAGYNGTTASSGATTLQLRGRNVLSSAYNSGYVNTIDVVNPGTYSGTSTLEYSQSGTEYNVANGIIGGNQKDGDAVVGSGLSVNTNDAYYGKQAANTALSYTTVATEYIRNAQGVELRAESETLTYRSAVHFAVSLGNDVGYGIAAKKLYGWGDNAYGQLTNAVSDGSASKPTAILADKNIVSVAAGKQLSSQSKPFYQNQEVSIPATLDVSEGVVSGINTLVKNDSKFISGAITETGELFVWSNENPEPQEIKYGNITGVANPYDKFAAVYSGYGNRIFAVTKIGKMIDVTYVDGNYKVNHYDSFNDKVGDSISNWTLNTPNNVTFTVPAPGENATPDEIKSPSLGSVKFYVWTAPATSQSVIMNGTFNNATQSWTQGAYTPLIKTNESGDMYRIFSADDDAKKSQFLSVEEGFTGTSFAPVYKFDGVEMRPLQQANMFTAKIVNDANGVGIEITPLQSSKGKTVTIEFWIARYNMQSAFSSSSDTAIYYDFKPCKIEFKIEDTPSVIEYQAFRDDGNDETTDVTDDGNANIPLLDPNNAFNKNYSLAVQDVSKGVDMLIRYLTAVGDTGTVNAAFKKSILDQMNSVDPGFPALSKVDDGNLSYYLGADVSKYNNVYQPIFADRDSDRIVVSAPSSGILTQSSGAVRGSVTAVPRTNVVTVNIASYSLSDDIIAYLAKDFNNLYGIYDIVFSADKTTMTFKYDVILFTAIGASGNIPYASDEVSSYQTLKSTPRLYATVTAATITNFDKNYAPITDPKLRVTIPGTNDIASVYSMPTLRLKRGNTLVTGQNDGNNTYTETYSNLIHVGTSVELKLTDYVGVIGDRIRFSFRDKTGNNDYAAFNNEFKDKTGSGVQVVSLTGTTLTIRPTKDEPIDLTVTMQRFSNTSNSAAFGSGNEKITVRIIFNNIRDFQFVKQNAPTKYLLTKTETFDLFGTESINSAPFVGIVADSSAMAELRKNARITGLISSEDSRSEVDKLFTVSQSEDPNKLTSFTVAPHASGTGIIQFTAVVYGKTLSFKLTVNVSSLTTIYESDKTDNKKEIKTITVVNDQYININELKSKLEQANMFNENIGDYKVLVDDIRNADANVKDTEKLYNAIYFTENKTDGRDKAVTPAFIKNAVIEGRKTDDPNIRIIASDSAVDSDTVYYMHVRFTNAKNVGKYDDAPEGATLETVMAIKSGKVNTNLSVAIDCKNPQKEGNWWKTEGSGINTKVIIDVAYLLETVQTESPTLYNVFLVTSDSKTATYFNYDKGAGNKTIIIRPLLNTRDKNNKVVPCTLNVSVSKENSSDSMVLSFEVTVDGILTKLPVFTDDEGVIGYANIWLYSFIIVFGVLTVIFIIRLIIYWKKRAKQRALIKRNQELIRMRDRMHNKANVASKEQVVRTKMKMEDPKYAKLFNEMRKDKENESGIVLENSDLAATAKSKSKKKKKGGKKTVAELKAELEAKKAAFAAAQAQSIQTIDPFVNDVPMADGDFNAAPDGFGAPVDGFGEPGGDFGAQNIDGNEIIFDASDIGDGM